MKLKKEKYLPIQSSSTIKEDDSRIEFERRIQPWKFVPFGQTHAAVDGTVETSFEDSTKTRLFAGVRFTVQLKLRTKYKVNSKHITTQIEVAHLNNWLSSFEPVLFVLYVKELDKFYFEFINEEFIQSLYQKRPKWISQTSVNIFLKIENVVDKDGLVKIEKGLANHKFKHAVQLSPGTYFESRGKLENLISMASAELKRCKIPYGQVRLSEIAQNVNTAIYTVTVVGETSVGKSTMVNALLSKQISPMDEWPTTGIPCSFQPGVKDYAEVVFKDDKRKKISATEKSLFEYVTQQKNRDNHKQVKFVSVYLVNEKMEHGLAYCDVPGLNDPDEKIEKIAKTAIFSSNAIIYIIDCSQIKGGGFFLKRNQIDDLRELKFRRDRLFLVVNKVDLLNSKELNKLKEMLEKGLKESGADELLSHPPIYVSSKSSFEKRVKGKGNDSTIQELETHLWTYLLENGKTGLHNLQSLTSEFIEEITNTSTIIKSRMLDSDKRKKLQSDVQRTRKELEKLSEFGRLKKEELLIWMRTHINSSVDTIIHSLGNWLSSFGIEQSLPSTSKIKRYLQNEASVILSDLFNEVNFALDDLYSETNGWVKNKLRQAELEIDKYSDPTYQFVSDFNHLISPINRSFFENRSNTSNLLEGVLFFLGDLVSGVTDLIQQIFIGKSELRKKQIRKILEKARLSYTDVFQNANSLYTQYVNNQYGKILNQIKDRANVYLGNIEEQLNNLTDTISDEERNNFEKFLNSRKDYIREAERIIIQFNQNIRIGHHASEQSIPKSKNSKSKAKI